jgi:hypothetical protein
VTDVFEVARFSTIPEGELAVALLRRHGIEARLPDRDMATMNPDLLIAIGGVRVVASAHQIDEARAIIARARDNAFIDPDDGETGDWRLDAVPGKVGDLDEAQVTGILGSVKKAGVVVIVLGFLVFPVASCLMTAVGR